MKKIIFAVLILMSLLFTGCEKKEEYIFQDSVENIGEEKIEFLRRKASSSEALQKYNEEVKKANNKVMIYKVGEKGIGFVVSNNLEEKFENNSYIILIKQITEDEEIRKKGIDAALYACEDVVKSILKN